MATYSGRFSRQLNKTATLCLASIVLALGGVPAFGDYTTVVDNGPSSNRVDIVFIGDGYVQADIDDGMYADHVDAMLDHLFRSNQDPFPRRRRG